MEASEQVDQARIDLLLVGEEIAARVEGTKSQARVTGNVQRRSLHPCCARSIGCPAEAACDPNRDCWTPGREFETKNERTRLGELVVGVLAEVVRPRKDKLRKGQLSI